MDDSHNFDGEHNESVAVLDPVAECESAALSLVESDSEDDRAMPEITDPKFKVKAADFHKQAALVAKVIHARHSTPLLQCLCVDVLPEGKLLLRGTDGERYAMADVHCQVDEGGTFLVQASRFVAVLSKLAGRVEFRMEDDQLFMSDDSGAKVMLQSTPVDGFPQASGQPDGEMVRFGVETEPFAHAVASALKSCAVHHGRYALNNVAFRFGCEGRLTIVGTDGRRLWRSVFDLDIEFEENVIGEVFLLTRSAADTLLAYIKDRKPDDLEIAISSNIMGVNLDGLQLYSQGNTGEYPDFDSVVPKENEYSLELAHQDLKRAIELSLITTSESSSQARVEVQADSIQIRTRASGVGMTEVECDSTVNGGEDVKLGFDPWYLKEGMSFFSPDSPMIKIDFQDIQTGAVFHQGEPEKMLYLVMPVDPS